VLKRVEVPMLAAALFVALLVPARPALAQKAILDGRTFVADAGVKGKEADEKDDVITFVDGRFHSTSCDKYGFGKGAYRAVEEGGAVRFEAQTVSEKDGRLVWKGTVRGSEIEGTFVHFRKGWLLNPNPDPIEHWFKGRARS